MIDPAERFTVVDLGMQLGEPRRFAVWDNTVSRFWKINNSQAWSRIDTLLADCDDRWPRSAKFEDAHIAQRDEIARQAFVLGFPTGDEP